MRTIAFIVTHPSQINVGDWFCRAAKGVEPVWLQISARGSEGFECHTAYGEYQTLTFSYLDFKLKGGPLFLMR